MLRKTCFLLFVLVFASCVPSGGERSAEGKTDAKAGGANTGPSAGSGAFGGAPTGGTDIVDINDTLIKLQHIVDPFDGNYKSKVTLPKNYDGVLLIAGLNLARLRDGVDYYVRFKFGRNLVTFVRPAWVGPAPIPGITITTTINVLHVDLTGEPFNGLRLTNYHLYDYNQYANDEEPITDPFDSRLYCRGLRLQHDPTFTGADNTSTCSQTGQKCLYSYASVYDQGLVAPTGFAVEPSEIQVALNDTGFLVNETAEDKAKKCLSNTGDDTTTLGAGPLAIGAVGLTDGTDNYTYNGPYEARTTTSWEITEDAVHGADGNGEFWGLFENIIAPYVFSTGTVNGVYSLKFPRAGRLPIRAGVEYIGTDGNPTVTGHATRTADGPNAADLTESKLMDGCNIRVSNFDPISREGIDACDVSATLEIVKFDTESNQFIEVDNSETSKLKVQLVRRTTKTTIDEEELVEANFRSCSSNNSCGSDECCYNKRCWSKDIVTQCIDDDNASGQSANGASCTSDLQCQSLCCSPNTGRCEGHNGDGELCSKPLGTACVADEFCGKVNQVRWIKVKTGINPDTGLMTCELRPFNIQVFGECKITGSIGLCTAPAEQAIPDFDASSPTNCDDAEDPPDPSTLGD